MSKKQKRREKQGGNLEVKSEFGDGHGKRIVGIGADVSTPCTGNQKIGTKMGTFTADEDLLVVGAVVRNCTKDES
jgi:hypothetical protein